MIFKKLFNMGINAIHDSALKPNRYTQAYENLPVWPWMEEQDLHRKRLLANLEILESPYKSGITSKDQYESGKANGIARLERYDTKHAKLLAQKESGEITREGYIDKKAELAHSLRYWCPPKEQNKQPPD